MPDLGWITTNLGSWCPVRGKCPDAEGACRLREPLVVGSCGTGSIPGNSVRVTRIGHGLEVGMAEEGSGQPLQASEQSDGVEGRVCDTEHTGCGGLCKEKGNASGQHDGQHRCQKCYMSFGPM